MSDNLKFFIVELSYNVPVEELGDTVAEHRAFLQNGYEMGWLLLSGPKIPRTGGMIVARVPSEAALKEFFSNDPYQRKGLATYRFIEFDPVKRAAFVEDWVQGGAI